MKIMKRKQKIGSSLKASGFSTPKRLLETIDEMRTGQFGQNSFKVRVLVNTEGVFVVSKPKVTKGPISLKLGRNLIGNPGSIQGSIRSKDTLFRDRSGGLKIAESVETTKAISQNLEENIRSNKDFYFSLRDQSKA